MRGDLLIEVALFYWGFAMSDIQIGKFKFVLIDENGEPRTTTAIIADEMGQGHASVIKLFRKYAKRMHAMGGVRFEIQPFKTGGGIQEREIAYLNEHQAALLLSLMRNTEKVVDFKVKLVTEFFKLRDELKNRDTSLWQQMQALISKEVSSQVRASFSSKLMLARKKEIPSLKIERDLIESQIQPSLLTH